MLKRAYSLKTRYNFSKVFKFGFTYNSRLFVIKYIKVKESILKDDTEKLKFGVVTSNKLTKKKVFHNKIKRALILKVQKNLKGFKENYYYVFIPKKSILDIIDANIQNQIESELQKFLDFLNHDHENNIK